MSEPQLGTSRIVIVGGGAGGLELATRLGDKYGRKGKLDITLIERNRTHVWKPKLHEIAAGSMDISAHEVDYLAQSYWHGFRYRIGEMIGIDRDRRQVQVAPYFDAEGREVTPKRTFDYDVLVVAIGSQNNDFGTPGVVEHAIKLESQADARRFHERMVNACIRAHAQSSPLGAHQLKVAIIGAGATGVELAAELHRTTREVVAYGLDQVDPQKDIRITLIEAADRVLPALPERVSKETEKLLGRLGRQCAGRRQGLRGRRRPCEPGGRPDDSRRTDRLGCGRQGARRPEGYRRPRNQPHQSARRPADAANDARRQHLCHRRLRGLLMGRARQCAASRAGGPSAVVPPVFPDSAASAGEPFKHYRYRDFGSLVSLGEFSTVGSMMGALVGGNLVFAGIFARMMYLSLYKMHEHALHGSVKVALDTLARLITRRTEPHVKLH